MHRYALPAAARIAAVESENYRTKTLVLDARLDAVPGQFVMVWLPRFDEKPFSLVSADPVTLMITAVGPFTRLVHTLQPGDRLWLRGPFGHGFVRREGLRRPALVGGGYGVAPLLWLARAEAAHCAGLHAILGARTQADLLYDRRFAALAHTAGSVQVHLVTEDGSQGARGLVTDVLAPLLSHGAVDSIFACGPHGMLAALARLAAEHRVPCQLSWEAYMRCAIGICGACEHEGKVLCWEGPVLEENIG